MLRRFIYLDAAALAQYVTALEGGLLTESTTRSSRSGTGAGGFDTKVISVSGEKSSEDEELKTIADTDESRFDRLLQAARDDPETLGWVEVSQPDLDYDGIAVGMMISWECDIFIPETMRILAKSSEALDAIDMIQRVMPAATRLGLDTDGLPDNEVLSDVSSFLSGVDAGLVVVGEDSDTDWQVAGQLDGEYVRSDVEGRALIVGKVAQKIAPGRWKPFLTLPGMNLFPREQRRKMERQPPEPGKEDQYLAGPALMLDVLAIYR